ncbi:hypothetical protein [Halorubrum kocurii]|uniref:Uncharacterized protein n=1 Tax=Halorubrum kocurii JCM 14978 TaxID=1230456 RepID=M0NQ95_9EURY|nr:hypothetical protein [Halorubrum kocurii]EMA59931.1 hypothetical protein C468_14103 [Halorubrum kocurii JCM 14978]
MTDTQSGSDAQATTDSDADLEASPEAGGAAGRQMGRRAFMAVTAATAVTAAGAGAVAGQSDQTINYDSEYAHEPTAIGTVTVAEHEPGFNQFGYIADDDSEATLEEASLAEREDESTPHNPVRIRADNVFFSDRRAFPRDLTTTNADDEEEDGSALDAEFWTTDESSTAGTVTVEDASEDRLRISTSGQSAGDTAVATFSEFTIGDGEQRSMLQIIANVDSLGTDTVVDVEVVDAAGDSVVATIDSSADSASDTTIATSQGQGILYQQQLGELPDGDLLDTIEKINVSVSEGNADVTFHGLNLESSSKWGFGTRESLNSDDEVETNTVRDQVGYFGITDLSTLYDSARLQDATVRNVEYPDARITPTDVSVTLEDGERYEYEHRLKAVHNFDLDSAYDLSIELTEWVDEVAHPSGRYLAMETATGLDEVVEVDETEDVEWTSRTSSYSDSGIGDEVSLPSTISSASVFSLSEDVLLRGDEADEVVVESGAAVGPTGRSGGGFLSRLFSIPGAIAGSIAGLGLLRMFRGGA